MHFGILHTILKYKKSSKKNFKKEEAKQSVIQKKSNLRLLKTSINKHAPVDTSNLSRFFASMHAQQLAVIRRLFLNHRSVRGYIRNKHLTYPNI
ncbi:hypothetical protein Taro_033377 [Colocasia esculenta]|uniref:Uncharacterized protein n=1 Tax=Colocasia esculenta TaxID=4460 RepID=A0A843W4K8_COLES|nr:hypothetical protein [Colocasia esculenta]